MGMEGKGKGEGNRRREERRERERERDREREEHIHRPVSPTLGKLKQEIQSFIHLKLTWAT